MKERTENILESLVEDFIETGFPITSELLYDNHSFGIKPAMIRWELNALTDEGFLYQRHPSGGRFPTNKAYQFFVGRLLELELNDAKGASDLMDEFLFGERKTFVAELAHHLGLLGVGYATHENQVYESGLRALLVTIEADEKEELVKVVNDFEALSERFEKQKAWWTKETNWPRVFIGASPLTKSKHLSVVASSLGEGKEQFLLLAIGPKRMDYKKSLTWMKSLARCVAS